MRVSRLVALKLTKNICRRRSIAMLVADLPKVDRALTVDQEG